MTRKERQTGTPESRGSQKRLEEIRQRASAALPGPWSWFGNPEVNVIHLATNHSGRMFILDPHTRSVETVFNHDHMEGYTVAEARERVMWWCPCAHEEHYGIVGGRIGPPDEDDALDWEREGLLCRCEDIREFLAWDQDPLAPHDAHLSRDGFAWLSRGVQVYEDLRFQDHGEHLMVSYRDIARYEVLDGRTMKEHLTNGGRESDLYREDIVGLDNPDATFIAHSRSDVDYLLAIIDRVPRVMRWWARRRVK